MDWFYDYNVDIYGFEEYEDEFGISRDKWIKKNNIDCDIQPVGIEKIKQSYGYSIEATFRMYSDEFLNESDVILWNSKTYRIKKIIPWDDYCISLLSEEVIDLGL